MISAAGANLLSSSFSVVQSHTQPASAFSLSVDAFRPSSFRFEDFCGGNFSGDGRDRLGNTSGFC